MQTLSKRGLSGGSLPPVAVSILKRAAQTPIPDNDPLARVRAIEEASTRVRHMFPDHFQKESTK